MDIKIIAWAEKDAKYWCRTYPDGKIKMTEKGHYKFHTNLGDRIDRIASIFYKTSMIHKENARVHDYATLLRKTFNVMCAMSGIVVRQFMSTNLYHIVTVLYCPEENLK